jgi:hypothetical protein
MSPITAIGKHQRLGQRGGVGVGSRRMRRTELSEMSMALAIARPVQWVAGCGGAGTSTPPPRGLRRDGKEERIMKERPYQRKGEPA